MNAQLTERQIIKAVCAKFNLSETELKERRRHKEVVQARSIAAYLLYRHAGYSQIRIAEALGLTDHTTISHHLNKFAFASDTKEKQAANALLETLLERPQHEPRLTLRGVSADQIIGTQLEFIRVSTEYNQLTTIKTLIELTVTRNHKRYNEILEAIEKRRSELEKGVKSDE